MAIEQFEQIPGRVFLDTCVVNLLIDHSETIHDNCAPSRLLTERGYAEAAISALPEPKNRSTTGSGAPRSC